QVNVKAPETEYISPGLRDFEERRKAGFGSFIDEETMRKNNERRLIDVLAGNLPVIKVFRSAPNGEYGIVRPEMRRWASVSHLQDRNGEMSRGNVSRWRPHLRCGARRLRSDARPQPLQHTRLRGSRILRRRRVDAGEVQRDELRLRRDGP